MAAAYEFYESISQWCAQLLSWKESMATSVIGVHLGSDYLPAKPEADLTRQSLVA